MWLERFSNQSGTNGSPPPPQNRSYSPGPRRPSHLAPGSLARTASNSRSSSLPSHSKVNSSTSSLPNSRITNGSTLKHQIVSPPEVDDPLDILQQIVGATKCQAAASLVTHEELGNGERPLGLAEEVDFNGLSLQSYIEKEADLEDYAGRSHQRTEVQAVEQYERENAQFEDLHRSITACDEVLKSVEISLMSFQEDLGHVSAEIETLQSRSVALNTRLENRKVVEKLLGPAVEEISISPIVIRILSEAAIDENWLKALAELEKSLTMLDGKLRDPNAVRAMNEVKPLVDNLTNMAVERIRDFLVTQIKALRSLDTNAQIIQQHVLLKYKDVWKFLVKRHPQLSEEISQAYSNTMRWYYLNQFTRYRHALDKISLYHADRGDALGGDQAASRAQKPLSSRPTQSSNDVINIGRRIDILKNPNQSAISSYVAEEDKSTHYMETPFRSFNIALVDNVSSEYSFLTEFFSTSTFHGISRRFAEIFDPTFTLGQSLTKDLIENSFDCLGILLCVRLNQRSAFELQRRKVPVGENYVNGTNILLWPRFQVVMDIHRESIRHLAAGLSGPSAALKLTFQGTSDANKQSTAPHYFTQRFSQFLYSILAISSEAGDDEPVANSLGRLRAEYDTFIVKASNASGSDRTKRERFLANNYALILTIIADAEGKLAQDQKKHFETLKAGLTR